jgi:hypothetical protein
LVIRPPSTLQKSETANGETTSIKQKPMAISLSGLLEYDETDTAESTFELSVFAEYFHELLCYEFGNEILRGLEEFSLKRTRNIIGLGDVGSAETSSDSLDGSEPPLKKQRTTENEEQNTKVFIYLFIYSQFSLYSSVTYSLYFNVWSRRFPKRGCYRERSNILTRGTRVN